MLFLLLTLAAIALFDSLSMVPLAVIPMTLALGSWRPWASAGAFVGGMFAAYLLCGVVLLLGAEFIFETFGAYFERLWNRPNALELTAQIIIGLLLIASTWYLCKPRHDNHAARAAPAAAPGALFALGATLIIVGIPGAVPYAAAIERIVRFDPSWLGALGALIFYNLIFVLPFIGLMAVRFLMPQRAGTVFKTIAEWVTRMMPRVVALLFLMVGLIMVADGIGWFLGYPLLPVAPQTNPI